MDDGRVAVDRRRQQHVRRAVHRHHLKTFPRILIYLNSLNKKTQVNTILEFSLNGKEIQRIQQIQGI